MIIELLEYIGLLQVHNLFHVNVKRNRCQHPSPPIVDNGGSFICVKPTERQATTCFNILLILKMHRYMSQLPAYTFTVWKTEKVLHFLFPPDYRLHDRGSIPGREKEFFL
jgi:hypothetical protein